MPGQLRLAADLAFEVTVPGRDTVHGSLRSDPRGLVLTVDDPGLFAGRGDASAVRSLAAGLASRGLTMRVFDSHRHLVTLGAVRGPWWQRRLTGSRHIRLGSLRGAWTSARSRTKIVDTPVLPDAGMLPPATMWPVAPTFLRRPRRRPTTTDDPLRGGNPRLVLAPGQARPGAHPLPRQWYLRDRTTLGSGAGCDIRLPGLEPVHASIEHDPGDEFVLHTAGPLVRVHGRQVESQVLRTGARLEVGGWVLTYFREEYADHGRPFSGRVGGELGYQRPQAPMVTATPSRWST